MYVELSGAFIWMSNRVVGEKLCAVAGGEPHSARLYCRPDTTPIPFPSQTAFSRGSLERIAAAERATPIEVARLSGRRGCGT
jgi:hypothetical protein